MKIIFTKLLIREIKELVKAGRNLSGSDKAHVAPGFKQPN
jgi:hypothetical protein